MTKVQIYKELKESTGFYLLVGQSFEDQEKASKNISKNAEK